MTATDTPSETFTARGRRALFLMSLIGFVAGYGAAIISYTLPYSREAMELSEGAMSWIFSATRFMSLIGVYFAIVADREGRRGPFLAAFTLIPLGNLVAGLLPSPIPFTLAQGVTRIGFVAVTSIAVVYLSEELTAGRRAFGLGVYGLSGAMGGGFALLILGFADTGDDRWRILFGLTALGLLVLPMLNRFLTESQAFVRSVNPVGYRQVTNSESGGYFWVLASAGFLIAAFAGPASDFVLERLINDLQWEAWPASLLLLVFSGFGTIGLLVGGRAADTVGRRPTIAVSILLGLAGGVGFYFASSGLLLGATVFLGTLGMTMLIPALAAQRAELFPTKIRATANGLVANGAILGSLLGFSLTAFFVDSIGLSRMIAFLSIGLIVAMWLLLQLPETRGKDLIGFSDRSGY